MFFLQGDKLIIITFSVWISEATGKYSHWFSGRWREKFISCLECHFYYCFSISKRENIAQHFEVMLNVYGSIRLICESVHVFTCVFISCRAPGLYWCLPFKQESVRFLTLRLFITSPLRSVCFSVCLASSVIRGFEDASAHFQPFFFFLLNVMHFMGLEHN